MTEEDKEEVRAIVREEIFQFLKTVYEDREKWDSLTGSDMNAGAKKAIKNLAEAARDRRKK